MEPAPQSQLPLSIFHDRPQNNVTTLDNNQIRALVLHVADHVLGHHHVDSAWQVQQHFEIIFVGQFPSLLHFYENKLHRV